MGQDANNVGKKVFFLYPPSVIRDEVFDLLITAGYEAYGLHDHDRTRKLLARFPGSILFVNLDQRFEEVEWEGYIRSIQDNPATEESRLGILSYNENPALRKKYLMDMAIACGYIQLKLGVRESTQIILDALAANEARGQRRYIRATCDGERNVDFNYRDLRGTLHTGRILDISSVGMAAAFDQPEYFELSASLSDVQIRLRGVLFLVKAKVMGRRGGSGNVWIVLFEGVLGDNAKKALHHFIKQQIQRDIDTMKV
jgi:hypothetical protein